MAAVAQSDLKKRSWGGLNFTGKGGGFLNEPGWLQLNGMTLKASVCLALKKANPEFLGSLQ